MTEIIKRRFITLDLIITSMHRVTSVMPNKRTILQLLNYQTIKIGLIVVFISFIYIRCNTKPANEERLVKDDLIKLDGLEVIKTPVSFTLLLRQDSSYRTMAFYKDQDSSDYSSFNYQLFSIENVNLIDEIPTIKSLWDLAKDSISVELNSVTIGYPLQYADVLKKHIEAFKLSAKWQKVKAEPIQESYKLMRKIMLESNVYRPMDSLLNTEGYKTTEILTEKHGFVTEEKLDDLGLSPKLKIPVPYVVWMNVQKQ